MGNNQACMFCDNVTKSSNSNCHYEVKAGYSDETASVQQWMSDSPFMTNKENHPMNRNDRSSLDEVAEMKQRAKLAREAAVALLGKLPKRKSDTSEVQERHARKAQGMFLHNKLMEALEEARKEAETKIIENMQNDFNVRQIKGETAI
eukprot:750756-Hanusia_phi.AAC.3